MKSWGYSEWYKNYKVEKDERRNDENVENNNRKTTKQCITTLQEVKYGTHN